VLAAWGYTIEGRRLSQLCPPYATPSSNSSLDYRRSDARIVESGFATSGGLSKSAKVGLARSAQSLHRLEVSRDLTADPRALRSNYLYPMAARTSMRPVQHSRHVTCGGRPGLRRQGKGGHPIASQSSWHRHYKCGRHQPASRQRRAVGWLPG